MNDYWNDPPEEDEFFECCGEAMNVTEDGVCFCPKCGKRIEPKAQAYDEIEQVQFDCAERSVPNKCPHGKDWGSCDACDQASDLAYDAERERNRFR